MKVNIEINCETINELLSHITAIKEEVKKNAKARQLYMPDDDFPNMKWQDNNCCGDHKVSIKEN